MSFASGEYLPFLLLCVALFQFVPARARVPFLCAASYCFYAWWSVPHLALLVLSTCVNFALGLALGAARAAPQRRALLGLGLACNLVPLAVFKYLDFALESLAPLFHALELAAPAPPGWALPLGISFYTFNSLGYTIDVYRKRIEPCRSPLELALYVSFFPQLVAGPIERAEHLLPQLRRLRLLDLAALSAGARLILWGLLKKRVLADRMPELLEPIFSAPEGRGAPALLLCALGLQAMLYLDFSAYTDIARGSARLFGVELVRNFDAPFLARSVTDYARRWHISLFRWIADYVHAPLSRGRLSHSTIWRANLVTMALFGLWHGAEWTFLIWGLASGVAISIEHSLRLAAVRRGRRRRPPQGRIDWRALGGWLWATALGATMIVFFFGPSLGFALGYFSELFALRSPPSVEELRLTGRLALLLATLFAVHAAGALFDLERLWMRIGWPGRALWLLGLACAILYGQSAEGRPFIYFQF